MDRSQIAIKIAFSALLAFAALACQPKPAAKIPAGSLPPFKMYLKVEPFLDATQTAPGVATYVFSNLYRGLTHYEGDTQVVFEQAEHCRTLTDTLISCKIRKTAKWNDSKPVTAKDFVAGFQRLLAPGSRCPALELLLGIKNARAVFAGKLGLDKLGVKAVSDEELQFELEEPDTEFLDKLSNPLFAPYRPPRNPEDKTTYFFNGPYQVKSWEKNRKIVLTPNPFYDGSLQIENHPDVEIVFAPEDDSAVNLYEKGDINFLWRINQLDVPKFRGRPDYFEITQARYDYLGFNLRPGSPFADKSVREAFARGANFVDFQKIFQMLAPAGCPGLDEPFINPEGHCVQFNPHPAHLNLTKPVKIMFSQMGGDDIRRHIEWFQEQWTQNLGVKVEAQSMEQVHYREILKESPPDIFRVGIMLSRPTCLAALEKFRKGDSENYTGFDNKRFNDFAYALSHQKLSRAEQESICGVENDILFKQEFVGIPLGRFSFAMMVDTHFKGWKVNELNQLDLSQLTYVSSGK